LAAFKNINQRSFTKVKIINNCDNKLKHNINDFQNSTAFTTTTTFTTIMTATTMSAVPTFTTTTVLNSNDIRISNNYSQPWQHLKTSTSVHSQK
jgi:hypothetical protein